MPNFPYKEPLIQAVILQSCKAFSSSLTKKNEEGRRWNLLFRVLISALHLFVPLFFSTFSMYYAKKRLKRRRWGRFYNLVHFSKEAIITDYLSITIRDTLDLHCSQNVAIAAINHRIEQTTQVQINSKGQRIESTITDDLTNSFNNAKVHCSTARDGFVSQLHNWSAHFSS